MRRQQASHTAMTKAGPKGSNVGAAKWGNQTQSVIRRTPEHGLRCGSFPLFCGRERTFDIPPLRL